LPSKVLKSLDIQSSVQEFSLDISCNRFINDLDIINLVCKMTSISKIKLNLDFCIRVTEDAIEEFFELVSKNTHCRELVLSDRNYSDYLIMKGIKSFW
jgi:hypothetical protein